MSASPKPIDPTRARSTPTQADRKVMAALGIAFRQGAYEFGGGRYDCLGDAVHYARLLTQQPFAM